MIKKILIPIFVLLAFASHAQLNNSWIDYSKTYYKFRLGKDTLCRITQPVLAGAGLGAVPAEQFQLWRNGEEVRLFTSVTSGPFSGSDYIEFMGQMNDGKPDNQLYRNADFQLADKYSLETDTVCYFLTVNPGSNLRFTNAVNNAPSAATPDAYFMRSIDVNYKSQINRGYAEVVGEYIYSSSFDAGEGWASNTTAPCCDYAQEFFNLNVYPNGPPNSLSVRVNAVGTARNTRNLRIRLYQNDLTAPPYGTPIDMSFFNYQKVNLTNLPLSLLQSTSYLPIYIGTTSSISTDRIIIAKLGLTYPVHLIL